MTDLAAPLAVGLAGFMAGMAYAGRGALAAIRDAVTARTIIVDGRAYFLAPLDDPFAVKVPSDEQALKVQK